MKKCFLFIPFIFLFLCSNSQNPVFQWAKAFGDTSLSVFSYQSVLDSYGNIYITGDFQGTPDFDPGPGTYTLSSNGVSDFFILKLDSAGNFVWVRSVGGTGLDEAHGITTDAYSNLYITGVFRYTVDFDPGPGTNMVTANGASDGFILKLDASGNFIWIKQMGVGVVPELVKLDQTNNIYLAGDFPYTADFDPSPTTYTLSPGTFMEKLDPSGNFIWAESISSTSSGNVSAMALDIAGNMYVTGYYGATTDFDPGPGLYNLTPAGSTDSYVCKLDVNGNLVWAKSVGGMGSDYSFSIALDNLNNVYHTGRYQLTADFDPGSGTYNLTSAGGIDIYVSKLDNSGNFIWAKSVGGPFGGDQPSSIAVDTVGSAYITGGYSGTCDFDPGPATYTIGSTPSSINTFIMKLDNAGGFVWAKNIEGPHFNYGSYIMVDRDENIFTLGGFQDMTDFDPEVTTYTITSLGGRDSFIHKMSQCHSISANITVQHTICDGNDGAVVIHAIGGTNLTYSWSNGDTSPVSLNLNAGTYSCVVTNTCGNSITRTVTLMPLSSPSVTVSGITMSANVTGVSYQWFDCHDNSPIAGETNQSFTPSANGNYAVIVTTGICQDTSACTNITTVGISEKNMNQQVLIYPNPTQGIFIIQLPSEAQVLVIDALSQIVVNDYKSKGLHTIDLNEIGNGMYFIKVISNTGHEIIKLVKQ